MSIYLCDMYEGGQLLRDPIDVYVGQCVHEMRKARRFSLEELGAEIGKAYQQVQKYQMAANRVSASQLWKIARALRVDVHTFFPNKNHDAEDQALIGSLERLPPGLCRAIGNVANAIADVERD